VVGVIQYATWDGILYRVCLDGTEDDYAVFGGNELEPESSGTP
jgi:hypothetical protein